MFDSWSRELIDRLPDLPGLDPAACRRALSRAYLLVVDGRLQLEEDPELVGQHATISLELRRMVAALESVAVFDPRYGPVSADVRTASAFVAAEALFLLGQLSKPSELPSPDPIQQTGTYSLLESALLYMVGGYDVNAVAVVRALPVIAAPSSGQSFFDRRCRRGGSLALRVQALCLGQIRPQPVLESFPDGPTPTLLADLQDDTRAHLYGALITAVDDYLAWLRGGEGVIAALEALDRVIAICRRPNPSGGLAASPFADVLHLSTLLRAALESTRERSVVHGVPHPTAGDPGIRGAFPQYLRDRALGPHNGQGRPFLWPSTLEYVRDALPGPHRDSVVSMPTGSGKSFLAELAVAHALASGWVVYLAPTNALAHQIRRDLDAALRAFDVQVSAFVGGEEYTTLADERVTADSVVVMTPEKCALAQRLYPTAFSTCSLCVFDECHLLNDPTRGVVADVLLAQLFHAAPQMRVLLMSAMVSNTEELAGWLQGVRGGDPSASTIKWRPSRTARGFVFVDAKANARLSAAAKATLDATTGAKTFRYAVPLAWMVGLSGPWTHDGPEDFRTAQLPVTATKYRKRSRKDKTSDGFDSWKNGTGRVLAELFASRGIPTIDFLLSSKHHAFSCADLVSETLSAPSGGALPPLVTAQLAVADAEPGVASALRQLLLRGVAVHTSALLPVEQAAAEHMFGKGHVKLMFATGTLAQGLNLPAVAVVVSGSQLGNPQDLRDADAGAGLTRATELILNGFGRAGRPGFSNQGFVVLVSNAPYEGTVSPISDAESVMKQYDVLAQPDAAIAVHSPVEKLLDEFLRLEGTNEDTTRLQLALIPLLAASEGEDENAGTLLRRTFAGYRYRSVFTPDRAADVTVAIQGLKDRFLEANDAPTWMPSAALKAGVNFIQAQRLWEAYQRRGLVAPEDASALGVLDWLDVLIDVLAHMPVACVSQYFSPAQTPTPRTRLFSLAPAQARVEPGLSPGWAEAWSDLGSAVRRYMTGRPFTEIGAALLGCLPSEISPSRSGRELPGVFKFLTEVVDRALTIDAGCVLAVHECWLEATYPGVAVPEPLQGLPLCVRNGCSDLDTLAWFRFGFRQRMCAHAFARQFPRAANAALGRRKFVEGARREWLRSEQDEADELLQHARTIITDGTAARS